MGADRNAALDQKANGLGRPAAAFKLDHLGTCLHQNDSVAQGLLFGLVVAAKRQIADQPCRTLRSTQSVGHAFGVVAHGFQANADGAVQALANHAQ